MSAFSDGFFNELAQRKIVLRQRWVDYLSQKGPYDFFMYQFKNLFDKSFALQSTVVYKYINKLPGFGPRLIFYFSFGLIDAIAITKADAGGLDNAPLIDYRAQADEAKASARHLYEAFIQPYSDSLYGRRKNGVPLTSDEFINDFNHDKSWILDFVSLANTSGDPDLIEKSLIYLRFINFLGDKIAEAKAVNNVSI